METTYNNDNLYLLIPEKYNYLSITNYLSNLIFKIQGRHCFSEI